MSTRRLATYSNPIDPKRGAKYWDGGWQDADGARYVPKEIAAEVARFLRRSAAFESWPGSRTTIDDVVQRTAPFRLVLVSLEPVVVLMQPTDDPLQYLVDSRGSPRPPVETFALDGLVNELEVHLRLPVGDEL